MFFLCFSKLLVIVINVCRCVNYQRTWPDCIVCALTNGLTMHREKIVYITSRINEKLIKQA